MADKQSQSEGIGSDSKESKWMSLCDECVMVQLKASNVESELM